MKLIPVLWLATTIINSYLAYTQGGLHVFSAVLCAMAFMGTAIIYWGEL